MYRTTCICCHFIDFILDVSNFTKVVFWSRKYAIFCSYEARHSVVLAFWRHSNILNTVWALYSDLTCVHVVILNIVTAWSGFTALFDLNYNNNCFYMLSFSLLISIFSSRSSLSLSLSLFLSLSLSLSLLYLSSVCLSVCLSVYFSLSLFLSLFFPLVSLIITVSLLKFIFI